MCKNSLAQNHQQNIKNNSEITQGIKLLAERRSQAEFNGLIPYRPQIIGQSLSKLKSQIIVAPASLPADNSQSEVIKIYPVILLAAIRSKQDLAARTWFIARNLDCAGTGWIYRADFEQYLSNHGITAHKQRRWINQALSCGLLFREHKICNQNRPIYRITGVRAAAEILGAQSKDNPIIVPIKLLLKRSWHAYTWAGYLATRDNRPISQLKLAQLTGISARTQQKYQRLAPVNKKRNYCQTDLDKSHLTGLRETRPSSFVGYKNKIYFRLPDTITVPESIAKRPPKQIRAKASNRKKSSKFSDKLGWDKSDLIRLFHNSSKSANSAMRKINNLDRLPWNRPQEIFIKKAERQSCNIWIMQSTAN